MKLSEPYEDPEDLAESETSDDESNNLDDDINDGSSSIASNIESIEDGDEFDENEDDIENEGDLDENDDDLEPKEGNGEDEGDPNFIELDPDEQISKEKSEKKKREDKKKEVKKKKKSKPDEEEEDDEEEEEEEEMDDENYLQKFSEELKTKVIQDYHPELHQHNYEEIESLSKVVRDENGSIIDPFHKTLPFLTKYEMAKIIGSRAMQIASGGKPFISLNSNTIDSYLIAMEELKQKKIPFIIKRPFPNGYGCEYWKLKDLEILE